MHGEVTQYHTLEFEVDKGLLQGRARKQIAHVQKPCNISKGFSKALLRPNEEGVLKHLWSAHAQFSDWLMVGWQGGGLTLSVLKPQDAWGCVLLVIK